MLTACANTARSPEPPELGLSAAYRFVAADADAPQPGPDDLAWWERFDDTALSVWIERALSRNLDLALARTRVDEARALLRAAQAGRAPQLGGQAQLVARNRDAGQGRRIEPSVGLTLEWDADLWGELASTEAAAAARLGEYEALQRATRLAIAALTARAYVAWREALVDRTQLADAIALQREVARV